MASTSAAIMETSPTTSRAKPVEKLVTTDPASTRSNTTSSQFIAPCPSEHGRPAGTSRWSCRQHRPAAAEPAASCSTGWIPGSRARTAYRMKTAGLRAGSFPRASGPVAFRGPEPRRIRRQHFIAQNELALHETKLKFRIGDDHALGLRVGRRPRVNPQREIPQSRAHLRAHQRAHRFERDILVVAALRLRGWREDWRG